MASHSPQRTRRSQPLLPNQGPILAMQARETSRSPSLRERTRTLKAQSMPMVPSVAQIFAANGAVPPSSQQQPSPTMPNISAPGRMLPIPPDQQASLHDPSPEPRLSPPSAPQYPIQQSAVNPHFPRALRAPPSFLKNFTDQEVEEHLQMTASEVLADIERSDQHQVHPSANSYSTSYGTTGYGQAPRSETPSPPKDPIERIRAMERGSPNNQEIQARRQRELARESPKARDRQPTSPSNPVFAQNQHSGVPTPERRLSPKPPQNEQQQQPQHVQTVHYGRDYNTRDSPGVPRRPANLGADPRSTMSYNQTPPLQSVTTRTPDRSLPFQEEAEDEFGPSSKGHWKETEHTSLDQHRISSPTPSSDLNPDGNSQRYDRQNIVVNRVDSRNGRRGDENISQVPSGTTDSSNRYSDKDVTGEDSGSYTPRSPTANLPDPRQHDNKYYQPQAQRLSPKHHASRVKSRNGSTDGLGLRTIDFDPNTTPGGPTPPVSNPERSPYVDHRPRQDNQYFGPQQQVYQQGRVVPQPQVHPSLQQQQQQQQQQVLPNHTSQYAPQQQQQQQQQDLRSPQSNHHSQLEALSTHQANYYKNGYYNQPQVYPDDFQNYSEDPASLAYLHAYLASPRPDAPIPPTPHSQSAAPSPSPFPNGYGSSKAMPYSPVVPVGSPYPYPFTHVRRNLSSTGGLSQYSSNYDPNHPAAIQEQLAKQWQIYLQNQVNGNMTDSTFSPAATPFQGANYNPFAFLHTARLTRQARETMSMHSSPSHEPIMLPTVPSTVGRKKDSGGLRHEITHSRRRPPPRVDSTQPRDTSPEPSSSGEETAGEYGSAHHPTSTATSAITQGGEVNGGGDTTANGAGAWSHPDKATISGESMTATPAATTSTLSEDDNSEDWIDEDDETDDSDMLDFEFHPNYIPNSDKRRRRWEVGWEGLVQAFQTLDRQTDTTMVVLAAPPHSSKLYSIRSRNIRRTNALRNSLSMSELRSNFKRLSTQRKNLRPIKPQTLAEKLLESQSSIAGDGSDGSTTGETREEDLKKALEMALGSLNMLNGMYEMRENRWQEEMRRMQEDKEKMSLVLNQVLGNFVQPSRGAGVTPSNGGGGEVIRSIPQTL